MRGAPGQEADAAAPNRSTSKPGGPGIQGQPRQAEPGLLGTFVKYSRQEQDTEPWSCLPGVEPGHVVESKSHTGFSQTSALKENNERTSS